ncbi:alpha-(1,6)-fucosyltransferase-like isoform X1 [Dermacentor albipictus]|uniref:alpha-(1,6)-fucosyltransferase-like isoform X1 n=2 Tax=Dermacentor albipictus TaxID=60249 RepID=UPI0038FD3B1C
MLSLKNRLSARTINAVLLAMCLCLGLIVMTGFSCRSFRYEVRISGRQDSPLIAFGLLGVSSHSDSTEAPPALRIQGNPSSAGAKTFDPTMLIGKDDVHVERLARLEATIAGMRDFLVRHMSESSGSGNASRAAATLVKAREYLRVMEADVAVIKKTDQAVDRSVEKMRKLRNFVRKEIERLQNPGDCESAPKLHCLLDNPWGFAAGVHDVLWCFVAALQMGRTLILNSTSWHYAPGETGWSEVFQPVAGRSCNGAGTENMIVTGYPGYDSSVEERSKILDLPASIVKDLVANHGDPYAWWYGQVTAYILRLQNSSRQLMEDFKKKNGYEHPIVAMHIRRTDKQREAAYHDVAEYMQHAEEFYSALALKGVAPKKRVFIATDDPTVISAIKSKFPSYLVISNQRSADEAFNLKSRTKSSALSGMLIDIHLLAESDYLVCGFSSGFCRVAYELMQARYAEAGADATGKAVSVDVEYFYAYVPFPPRRTLYHNERVFGNELQWRAPGALVERSDAKASLREAREKMYADGFNTGRLVGSKLDGNKMVFPRFKTVRTYSVAPYASLNQTRR